MKFSYRLTAALMGSVMILVQSQSATALEESAINKIARQITVRIDGKIKDFDGEISGSGVIIGKQDNTYTVLTNWHVVQTPGNYNLRTPDGEIYQINSSQIQQLENLDLAILQFSSSINYPQAKLGNSSQLTETSRVYAAGWANPDAICLQPCYRFVDGKITAVLSTYKEGYGLIYSNNIVPGMSGGPVLDQEGRLVGINGRASTTQDGITSFGAIPINEYKKYQNVVTASKPIPTALSPTPTPTYNTPLTTPTPIVRINQNSTNNFYLANTLINHDGAVSFIAFSPNGETLAIAIDKIIKIWNIQTGQELRTLSGHSDLVKSLVFSPDGQTLASGGINTIKIWNINTGKEIYNFSTNYSPVDNLVFSPNGKILASSAYITAELWNIETGQKICSLSDKGYYDNNYYSRLQCSIFQNYSPLAFSPDSNNLITVLDFRYSIHSDNSDERDNKDKVIIKVRNIGSGKLIRSFSVSLSEPYSHESKVFSQDGQNLAMIGEKNIDIWSINSGEKIRTLSIPNNINLSRWGYRDSLFNLDSQILVVQDLSNTETNIKIWNMKTGEEAQTITGDFRNVAISPYRQMIAIVEQQGNIQIWQADNR